MVTCGEGRVSRRSCMQRSSSLTSKAAKLQQPIFGTSIGARGMRNTSTKFCMAINLDERKNSQGRPRLQPWPNILRHAWSVCHSQPSCFFYTKLSCRNIGEIARRCLLSKKLPQLSWPNVTLRNTCITVHGHFQLFLFFSSTSYNLQQVTTLRPCMVQVQWRRKQFASGGIMPAQSAGRKFFDVPPTSLVPPTWGGTVIVCYRLRDNWSVPQCRLCSLHIYWWSRERGNKSNGA